MKKFIKHGLWTALAILLTANSATASASQSFCSGQIVELLKWNDHENISILIQGTRRYLQLPSPSDRAMAIMAFEQKLPVKIQWRSTASVKITDCKTDWQHYEILDGFMSVKR